MAKRSSFPGVFWFANTIEVLERFAYYGIYMSLGIYLEYLGYSKGSIGFTQSLLLGFSYLLPMFAGTFADKYGFKKLLIFSYILYIPAILLLSVFKSATGIGYTMLMLGFAAGIFKPLIAATVRATTDSTNKTVGFGVFYAMVNVGASAGPIVMGKLRGWDWNMVFYVAALAMGLSALITLILYKEPKREIDGISLGKKFADMWEALSNGKFFLFLVILGLFFWLPFWAFFNVLTMYINSYLDISALYESVKNIFGAGVTQTLVANFDKVDQTWKLNAEAIAHTGYIIIIFQVIISRIFEKKKAIPSFVIGLVLAAVGFIILGLAVTTVNQLVFLGIFFFAFGEMISSPRIQEYIMWIAPKEKAGLYMGTSFFATFIGAVVSGLYTWLMGIYKEIGHPEYIMYTLAANLLLGIVAINVFVKLMGDFNERSE